MRGGPSGCRRCSGAGAVGSRGAAGGARDAPQRRRVGRRRRRGASRQAYQAVAGLAREPHSTFCRWPRVSCRDLTPVLDNKTFVQSYQ